VLDAAQPMVRMLWQRETEGKVFDSPERKAALDKTLRATLKRIQDPSIRSHYGEDIKDLRWELFRQGRKPARSPERPFGSPAFTPAFRSDKFRPGQRPMVVQPTASTRASLLGSRLDEDPAVNLRLSVVLATLCLYPSLINRFEGEVERLRLSDEEHEVLRHTILAHAHDADPDTCAQRLARAAGAALETLLAHPHLKLQPHIRIRHDAESAGKCLEMELAKLSAHWGAIQEIREAVEDMEGVVDEGLTWRLMKASSALVDADRGPEATRAEGVIAPNGVEMNKDELEQSRRLMDSIVFTRGGKQQN